MGEDSNAYNIANPNSILSIREMAEIIADIGNKNEKLSWEQLHKALNHQV